MEQQSFFEFLSISNQERIHSQIISWMFSKNFNGMTENAKIGLINSLFNVKCNSIDFALTEHKNIDILIKTDTCVLVVENKLKSSQHSNQLEKYRETCKEELKNINVKYFFLSLIGENSGNEIWKEISYKQLYKCIRNISLVENSTHSIIFKEYANFLDKLVTVFDNFNQTYNKFPSVFLNGNKRKIDKLNHIYKTKEEEFIGRNQLETIFQKCLLNRVSNSFNDIDTDIFETRGEALIDFIFDKMRFENNDYDIFLEMQSNTLKFAVKCRNNPNARKEWIEPLIPHFDSLKKENESGYKKLNIGKSKAYISISKKMTPTYWEINFDELIKTIEEEINSAKEIARNLKSKINNNVS